MDDADRKGELFLRWFGKKRRRFLRKAKKRRFYPVYASLLLLFLWALLFPASFSSFIWTYFWGPVVADVQGHPVDGIHEGYNAVNTLTYGLLLAAAVYYGWPYLRKKKLWFGPSMLLALSPLIFAGSLSRVLEDAGTYPSSVAWIFVSPFIYLLFGFLALFYVLFSSFLEKRERYEAVVLSAIVYPFSMKFLWYLMNDMVSTSDVIFFTVLALLFVAFHTFQIKKKGFEMVSSVFLYSTYVLSIFAYYAASGFSSMNDPFVILLVPAIALFSTSLIWLFSESGLIPEYFMAPMSLAMIFAQSLDGAATWIGTAYGGYGEKHVLSRAIIGDSGPFFFFLSKFLLSIFLVFVLHETFDKRGSSRNRALGDLIRFFIVVLGLAPGIRDMLRMALGV